MASVSCSVKASLLLLVLAFIEVSAQEHHMAPSPAPAMANGTVAVTPGARAVALASLMSIVALSLR
ncbi:hypothetical protein MUK42_02451 [Musa troglodytarum]|uniref:Uncharacterized protein n=1 Tax=Musa troglodytarum TaxID=320322 RepID=A0A9E7KHK6_9LILI|nr:hypothetical protein MUK42_02451 [Musa troglodytarum]